jgi:1,2-diacylglycerol 3-beta-galactosyltransferase
LRIFLIRKCEHHIYERKQKTKNSFNNFFSFSFQEAGNVPYVVENGCGKYSKSPKEIAKIVSEWFGPKAYELRAMSQNALKLARPDAVFKIVHDLHELVKQRSLLPHYSCAT